MDPRHPQGETNPPSLAQRPTPQPGPHAPWEAGASDRPPMLPPQQQAPWQEVDAPWHRPAEREAAPWDGSGGDTDTAPADAARHVPADEGPIGIEVPPWDAPPPFTFEEPPADDRYDAYAPLAEDFEPARPAVAPLMTAAVVDRPATSVGDRRSSVFGDMFTRPQPEQAPRPADEPARAPADEPAAEQQPDGAGAGLAAEATAAQEQEAGDEWPAEADPSAERDPPPARDPLEWPPVPTEFPPADAAAPLYARQPSHDPLEWPPIPRELLHVPEVGTNGAAHSAAEEAPAAEAEPGEPIAPEWSEQTPPQWSEFEAHVDSESTTRAEPSQSAAAPRLASEVAAGAPESEPESEFEAFEPAESAFEPAPAESQPARDAWPAGERVFAPPMDESAETAAAPAAAEWPVAEAEQLVADADQPVADADQPVADAEWPNLTPEPDPYQPLHQPEPIGDQRGAVFARYAAQSIAPPADLPAAPLVSVEQPAAAAPPARADGTRHLWFLSGEPDPGSAAGAAGAERHPSSAQTLILTVLVALAVIALVILFLALFTSFFG